MLISPHPILCQIAKDVGHIEAVLLDDADHIRSYGLEIKKIEMLLHACRPSWTWICKEGFGCTRAFVVGLSVARLEESVGRKLFAMDSGISRVTFMDKNLTTCNISQEIDVIPPVISRRENIYLSALNYEDLKCNLTELTGDFQQLASARSAGELE